MENVYQPFTEGRHVIFEDCFPISFGGPGHFANSPFADIYNFGNLALSSVSLHAAKKKVHIYDQ